MYVGCLYAYEAAVWLYAAGEYCDGLPVVARYKAWVYGLSLAGTVGSNPTVVVCVSGNGLCDELITHPEKSYGVWCVCLCS
jgi:hypothetical protein